MARVIIFYHPACHKESKLTLYPKGYLATVIPIRILASVTSIGHISNKIRIREVVCNSDSN